MRDATVTSSGLSTDSSGSVTSLPPRDSGNAGRAGLYDWTRHTRTYSVNIAPPGTARTRGGGRQPLSAPSAMQTGPTFGVSTPLTSTISVTRSIMSTTSNPFSVIGGGARSSVPRTISPLGTTQAPGFFGPAGTRPGDDSRINFLPTPVSTPTDTERLREMNARLTNQLGQEGQIMQQMQRMHDEFDAKLMECRTDACDAEERAIRAERHLADLEKYVWKNNIAPVAGPTATHNSQAISGPRQHASRPDEATRNKERLEALTLANSANKAPTVSTHSSGNDKGFNFSADNLGSLQFTNERGPQYLPPGDYITSRVNSDLNGSAVKNEF